MPLHENKVKRIVSTNINAHGNPIKPAAEEHGGSLPFLVGRNGIINVNEGGEPGITAENFQKDWDVLVLADNQAGLPKLPQLHGFEVFWLIHGGKDAAEAQRPGLEKLFDTGITHEEPFHHDQSGYGKYLDFVANLCAGGDAYSTNLSQLDENLRKKGMEAAAVELLWLLAALSTGRADEAGLGERLKGAARERYRELKKLGVIADRGLPFGMDILAVDEDNYRVVKKDLMDACREGRR